MCLYVVGHAAVRLPPVFCLDWWHKGARVLRASCSLAAGLAPAEVAGQHTPTPPDPNMATAQMATTTVHSSNDANIKKFVGVGACLLYVYNRGQVVSAQQS